MRILFYESLAIYWLIIIIALFVGYSAFVIVKDRKKWKIHTGLFALRCLSLGAILLYIHKPAAQFIETSETYPPVPVFVDQSFSMAQDITPLKNGEALTKAQQQRKIIRNMLSRTQLTGNKLRFELYEFTGDSLRQMNESRLDRKPYGIFNLTDWLKYVKEFRGSDSPSVILMSDLNHDFQKKNLMGLNKRVYAYYNDEAVMDNYIRSVQTVRKANGVYLVKVKVIRTGDKAHPVTLTLYSNQKALVTRTFILNRKENWLYVMLNVPFTQNHVIRASIKTPVKEGNMLNNHHYFRVRGRKDSRKVHLVFGRPSFDLSFLRNFMRRQEKYDVRVYIPRPGQAITLPWLNPKDKVVLGDIDTLAASEVNKINRFVLSGGLLVFLRGDSELKTLLYTGLAGVIPFQYYEDRYQHPAIGERTKMSLSISRTGKNFPFLNFRDPDSAAKVWDELAVFPVVKGNILRKRGAMSLGEIDDKTAILYQKVGRGQVLAVLFDELWKMDFGNKGFGIQSSFYDQFWDEILRLNEPGEGQRLVNLLQQVYEFGDRVKIFVSRKDLSGNDRLEIRGAGETERHEIAMSPVNGESGSMVSFRCRFLGENKIVLKRKGRPDMVVARYYVNYPQGESRQRSNAYRKKLAQRLTESTGGRILTASSISELKPDDIHLRKISERVVFETKLAHRWFTLLFIVMLLSSEWVVRRYYLG